MLCTAHIDIPTAVLTHIGDTQIDLHVALAVAFATIFFDAGDALDVNLVRHRRRAAMSAKLWLCIAATTEPAQIASCQACIRKRELRKRIRWLAFGVVQSVDERYCGQRQH